ncbi:hypothetical protein [Pseudoalteromonas denitrificans]|uniref:Pyocin activator protein PrtN n=1 Tax=Pseudoalteromonas denitrificans DSM 6059 TaxID=1123010 RepID=A0A1I1ETI7_9GAMM|nr:hypothetical protein [Pseudoalteromonas denitrificans]SFB90317.1 hypothetical protein SAMN02745724_00432 [Pseudoalteromonas denitrificans DSM 6059]
MTTLNLSIPAPILTFEAYAQLTGEKTRDIINAVAVGKLPVYIPPHPPTQNTARVKKYINVLAIYIAAAESANIELNIA